MKRTVVITSTGAHVALRNQQLVISRDRIREGSVPVEDLGILLLEAQGCTITASSLAAVAEQGGITIVVDTQHMPTGVLLPVQAHSTGGPRVRAQASASKPLQKNLWRLIVQAKIHRQADLIEAASTRRRLRALAKRVRSGDPENLEAQAARAYWPAWHAQSGARIPGDTFRRRSDGDPPNGLLNYGYAILRACIARCICAAGLIPSLGVHHHNKYDGFCLANDLMEPFRPWVDALVLDLLRIGMEEVNPESKTTLLELPTTGVCLEGTNGPLWVAVERTCSSLAAAFLAGSDGTPAREAAAMLALPQFPDLRSDRC